MSKISKTVKVLEITAKVINADTCEVRQFSLSYIGKAVEKDIKKEIKGIISDREMLISFNVEKEDEVLFTMELSDFVKYATKRRIKTLC